MDAELAAGQDRGILHGIPYGAKDLFSFPGYPTTWGAGAYKEQVLDETAGIIRKLEEAGAILVATMVALYCLAGGIRASIDAGPVTMGEVLTVLPFQNTLSTFQVNGATIVEALENGVSQIEEGAGRFPQVAGISFTVDAAAEPGSRVSDVMVGGAPIDPEKLYGVVSNNFVRNGGDGYKMFVDAQNAYDFGPDLADVTAEYLAEHAPYTPYTDGRITVTCAAPDWRIRPGNRVSYAGQTWQVGNVVWSGDYRRMTMTVTEVKTPWET